MKFKDTKYKDMTGKTYYSVVLYDAKLTSLEGSPKIITTYTVANTPNLTSLEFGPSVVKKNMSVYNCGLTSLKYAPKKGQNFDFSFNKLTTLVDGPETVDEDYNLKSNLISNLEGAPTYVGGICDFSYNPNLTSLKGTLKEVGYKLSLLNCPNLKYPKEQIIKYQIKAPTYYTDEGEFDFEDIASEFNNISRLDVVKRKGFRTLLGIDK